VNHKGLNYAREDLLLVGRQLRSSKPGSDSFHCSIDSIQLRRCCPTQDAAPTAVHYCTH